MPARSTRNRIRWNLGRAADQVDGVLESLMAVDLIQGDRSQILTDQLPVLVIGATTLRDAIRALKGAC